MGQSRRAEGPDSQRLLCASHGHGQVGSVGQPSARCVDGSGEAAALHPREPGRGSGAVDMSESPSLSWGPSEAAVRGGQETLRAAGSGGETPQEPASAASSRKQRAPRGELFVIRLRWEV